jgi:hypothetical protein
MDVGHSVLTLVEGNLKFRFGKNLESYFLK